MLAFSYLKYNINIEKYNTLFKKFQNNFRILAACAKCADLNIKLPINTYIGSYILFFAQKTQVMQ